MVAVEYFEKDDKIRTGLYISENKYGIQVKTADGEIILVKRKNLRFPEQLKKQGSQ